MKKIILILTIINSTLFAQTGINYQGAATDDDGAKLVNQNISLKTSVLQGGVDGTTSYSEIHNTTTDQFGLFNVVIGQGVSVSGDFETISWGSDDHFLKVELDATGGTNYNLVSTTQMMSVPYALYAKNAGLDSVAVADMLASMNISGNSGYCDFKFPDGLMGDPITYYLNTAPNGTYTVEAGKNLYITNLYTEQYHKIRIDGIIITEALFNMTAGNNLFGNTLANPLILKENQTISIDGGFGAFNGFLVPPKVEPVTHYLSSSSNDSYTVEDGKNLYITNLYTEQYYKIKIDGIIITEALFNMTAGQNKFGNTLSLPLIVKPGQTITLNGGFGSFNGYLVDEDFFADCGGSGGSSSSTPSSIDSAMVADMIAANTSSGSGGDWELLYDNFEADLPGFGSSNEFGIAPSDGFLYISGSNLEVRTGFDLDTIENTWSEEPHFHYIQGASINSLQPDLIPVKKDMFWSINLTSSSYITKGYFIPNGGGSSSLANSGMSGTSKSFKFPDGLNGEFVVIDILEGNYTVPDGKNLYILNAMTDVGNQLINLNGKRFIFYDSDEWKANVENVMVGSGYTLSNQYNSSDGVQSSTMFGFLANKKVEFVAIDILEGNYTVPEDKNLYILNAMTDVGNQIINLNGKRFIFYDSDKWGDSEGFVMAGPGSVLSNQYNSSDGVQSSTMFGYLADLDYFESPSSSSSSNSGGEASIENENLVNETVEHLDSLMQIISPFLGCTDETACNFDENAVIDDGTCEGLIGCTNSLSSNFNPDATCDDQSCNPYVGQFIEGGIVVFVDESDPSTGLVCSYNNFEGDFYSCNNYAESLVQNGYDDWRLPTKEELANLYGNLNTINTFLTTAGIETFNLNDCQTYTEFGCLNHYWSSTQCNTTTKWFLSIATNSTNCRATQYGMNSRPVRDFNLNEDH